MPPPPLLISSLEDFTIDVLTLVPNFYNQVPIARGKDTEVYKEVDEIEDDR